MFESLQLKEFDPQNMVAKPMRKKPATKPKVEEEPPPPPPPTFSEDELKNAERDGYQRGFLDGIKEGQIQAQNEQAAVEQALTEILQNFTGCVGPIFEHHKQTVEWLRSEMPKLAISVARKVTADAVSLDGLQVIEHTILGAIETVIGEPTAIVTVNPRVADVLRNKCAKIIARAQSACVITVVANESVRLQDYRVEWKYGNIERDTAQVWHRVERAIASLMATLQQETDAQLDLLSHTATQHLPSAEQNDMIPNQAAKE
jgi:flagellar assembly protein FliH